MPRTLRGWATLWRRALPFELLEAITNTLQVVDVIVHT
jgi:hypothetical protein